MKSWNVLLCVLLTAVLFVSVGSNAKVSTTPAKIGVVSINEILKNSQKHKAWQEQMGVEEKKLTAEFDKMQSELKMIDADMKTRTRGSEDYNKLGREYAQKKAIMDALDKQYEQEITTKVQVWTETIYQLIQKKTSEVAKMNGLDLVISKQEVDIPSPTMRDLLLSIRTNTVVYSSDTMDITQEVLAAVDKQ